MIFKRRTPLSWLQTARQLVYPRGGWSRAIEYIRLRLRRLPDTPEKIGRGIFCGVFMCFTPFFGLHMVLAYFMSKLVRGNALAALLATFFGNPLTFVAIAALSLRIGHVLLGQTDMHVLPHEIGQMFADSWREVKHNTLAPFSDRQADWRHLRSFYTTIFLPYLVGGIAPGMIAASISYISTVPLIRAYQNRRRKKLGKRLERLAPK